MATPPPPGDSSNLLHLPRVRANLWESGISSVLALSPLGHMLLSDSCLTALARGTQSFQPKFDKHTFLLSVLLWAICQGGMVPSLARQDAEIGPPRKVQRQCCPQRERGAGGEGAPQDPREPGLGRLSPSKMLAPTASSVTRSGTLRQKRLPQTECFKAVLPKHPDAYTFLGTLFRRGCWSRGLEHSL